YPQAEGADGAEGPHPPPVERCAVSVRAVLDEDEVARPREREDRAEVDRQAIEMHDEDAACPFHQARLEGGGIGPQIIEPDVDRNRRHPRMLQGLDAGDEAV